jgi:hypothetical protein
MAMALKARGRNTIAREAACSIRIQDVQFQDRGKKNQSV